MTGSNCLRDRTLRDVQQCLLNVLDDLSQARRPANPFVHGLSANAKNPGCCGWPTVSFVECGFDLRDAVMIGHFVKIGQ